LCQTLQCVAITYERFKYSCRGPIGADNELPGSY
jgi:hypothetical protein